VHPGDAPASLARPPCALYKSHLVEPPVAEAHPPVAQLSNVHYLLVVLGGLMLGTGLVNLYWSFGDPNHDLNGNAAEVGWSGLDDIAMLPSADVAIPLLFAGIGTMVFLNARAWRYTGGY
jgi:hypothetical protein